MHKSKPFTTFDSSKQTNTKTTDMESMTNLTVSELELQLKNFTTNQENLIESYKIFPSEELQDRIIDLGKTIGTIQYEINYKRMFNK